MRSGSENSFQKGGVGGTGSAEARHRDQNLSNSVRKVRFGARLGDIEGLGFRPP